VFGKLAEHVGDGHLVSLFIEFGQWDGAQLVVPAAHLCGLKQLHKQIFSHHLLIPHRSSKRFKLLIREFLQLQKYGIKRA